MPETDQARKADQQIEAHREDGEDHHLGGELNVEALADERKNREPQCRNAKKNKNRPIEPEHVRPLSRRTSRAAATTG